MAIIKTAPYRNTQCISDFARIPHLEQQRRYSRPHHTTPHHTTPASALDKKLTLQLRQPPWHMETNWKLPCPENSSNAQTWRWSPTVPPSGFVRFRVTAQRHAEMFVCVHPHLKRESMRPTRETKLDWFNKNRWDYGVCPSSTFYITRKHNVSETGSVSVLRWSEGHTKFAGCG
jgi:hypothetical protein